MHEIYHKKTAKGGGIKMTNEKLLEQKIAESGKKKGYLAAKCGLSRQGFKNCLKGDALFIFSHILKMTEGKGLLRSNRKERTDRL